MDPDDMATLKTLITIFYQLARIIDSMADCVSRSITLVNERLIAHGETTFTKDEIQALEYIAPLADNKLEPEIKPGFLESPVPPAPIQQLSIERDSKGGSDVEADGKRFHLPPKLTSLLIFLATRNADDDGLPQPQSDEAIAAAIGTTHKAVSNLVCRLRRTFKKNGLSASLIDGRRPRDTHGIMQRRLHVRPAGVSVSCSSDDGP